MRYANRKWRLNGGGPRTAGGRCWRRRPQSYAEEYCGRSHVVSEESHSGAVMLSYVSGLELVLRMSVVNLELGRAVAVYIR